MTHLDEGPRGALVVLLPHGEPTWSYLPRSVVVPCAEFVAERTGARREG